MIRRGTTLLAVVAGVLAAQVSTAAAAAPLSRAQAGSIAKLALQQDQHAKAKSTACDKRGTSRAVCRMRWTSGLRAFRGTIAVTRTGTAISPVDTYTINATGRARYLDPERVRASGRVIIETRRARIGQTLRLFGYSFDPDDLEVTVGAGVDPFVPANEFSTPADGTRFVAYPVTVRDVGTQRYSGSLYGLAMILADGRELDPGFADGCSPSLDLGPGEFRQVCVAFEVPLGATIQQLQLKVGEETGVWTP